MKFPNYKKIAEKLKKKDKIKKEKIKKEIKRNKKIKTKSLF